MPSNLLTELYNAYKDWCIFNRLSPDSARRLCSSVWEILRVKTYKTHGRRLFKTCPVLRYGGPPRARHGGIRLSMKELQRTRTGHEGHEGQKQGGSDFPKAPCLPKLDRIRPSFGQGAKGAKGAFFEKTFFSTPKVFRPSVIMPANKSKASSLSM